MGKQECIQSSRVYTSGVGSSHAVKAGDHIFLTGMTGRNVKGKLASLGSIEEQAKQAFENAAWILDEAGASWKDVVKMMVYVSHHRSWAPISEILKTYLNDASPPISVVAVSFPDPDLLLELDIIVFSGPKKAINPPLLPDVSVFGSSHAVAADKLIHMRGQSSLNRDGKIEGPGDIHTQTASVWAKLQTICKEADVSLEDLVKLNIYMSNPNYLSDVVAYRRDTYPHIRPTSASSFVGFTDPRVLISVDGWAYQGKKEIIYNEKAWNPEPAGSSQAILLENGLMPIIGISARNLDGSYHGIGSIQMQCVRTMEIVAHILEKAGGTFDNVVKLASHVSHPQFASVAREVRSRFLGNNKPALLTTVVHHPSSIVLVKTEAWAYLG
jgi:enamine deaminase RidA (YjgF/YER057c/UK114 family)